MYNMARLEKRTGQVVEAKTRIYTATTNELPEDVFVAYISGSANTSTLTLPAQGAYEMRPLWVYCTDLTNAVAVRYNSTALYTFTAADTATFYLWDGSTWRFMKHPTI